ncbi:hypothetical protein JCM8097_000241 [Rhodosporidiobolus ruineniae]
MATHPTTATPPKDVDLEEKGDYASSQDGSSTDQHALPLVADEHKSRGVRQMERLTSRMTTKLRIMLYGSFTVLGLVFWLDAYTTSSYRSAAASYFGAHSTLTTITSLVAVFKAVSQPPLAKLSNVAGRVEVYAFCVFLYALGWVIAAAAPNIYAHAAGAVINTVGDVGLGLLQSIIIADTSSLRNRLFWLIFPALPGTIWGWLNGDITQSLLGKRQEHLSKWRWGIGMLAILVPALATPVLLTMGYGMRPLKGEAKPTRKTDQRSLAEKAVAIFWELDLVGLLLMVSGFSMLLTIVTIANGKGSHWDDPHSIALLTVGGILIISFFAWEAFGARRPLLSLYLLKNRNVVTCLACGLIYPIAGGIIQSYFYTYMLVTVNETTKSATRINWAAAFAGTWTTAVVGLGARYIRYIKPIVVTGFALDVLALGLYVRYRDAHASQGDLAGVQVLRGIAGGMIGYPLQAAIQSSAARTDIAHVTAMQLLMHSMAAAIGSAIGGGIWSNLVPAKLNKYIDDPAIAKKAYANPLALISKYAPGTAVRDGLGRAHGETQRVLAITACSIAAFGFLCSLALKSIRLTDEVTLKEAEGNQLPEEERGQRLHPVKH